LENTNGKTKGLLASDLNNFHTWLILVTWTWRFCCMRRNVTGFPAQTKKDWN